MKEKKEKKTIDSIYQNTIGISEKVQHLEALPPEYHCTCQYCNPEKFKGEIFNIETNKYYSNKGRKLCYVDQAGDHLDVGQFIGYRWAIQEYCPVDGWVLDPTVGSGTSIVEAINIGRNAIGIELEYPETTRKNIEYQNSDKKVLFRQGNATHIDEYLEEWNFPKNGVDLILNGTPYPTASKGGVSSDAPERRNIIDKTKVDKTFDYMHPDNIGITMGKDWEKLIIEMYSKSISYLKQNGYFIILIKDMIRNKKAFNLHGQIIDLVLANNPDMAYEGFFIHRHCPTTLFMNTYGKRYPEVKIPIHQTGIILKKIK